MTHTDSFFTTHLFDSLSSTNEKLNELLRESGLPEFSVVITPNQTAGKGQAGNSWESEKGKNITLSVLLKPLFLEPHNQFYISKVVSLAIVDTLEGFNIQPTVKWPNDIYVDDKKIAGILIENSIMGNYISNSIAGIGINVNQERFISDAKNPVSVHNILNEVKSIEATLDILLHNLLKWYTVLIDDEPERIDNEYFDRLYRKDGFYRFKDVRGEFSAKISGVETSGILVLTDSHGQRREYAFKEVEFLD
jgi:BirA family biotin operon repressor/biotin-[acetyl-CoA-carboxylase] ligase